MLDSVSNFLLAAETGYIINNERFVKFPLPVPFITNERSACVSVSTESFIYCGRDKYDTVNIDKGETIRANSIVTLLLSDIDTIINTQKQNYYLKTINDISFESSCISIRFPSFGAIVSDVLNISLSVHPYQYNQVYFDVIGIISHTVPADTLLGNPLFGMNIEPASWFYSVAPARDANFDSDSRYITTVSVGGGGFAFNNNDRLNKIVSSAPKQQIELGYPTFGYIEFVLSDDRIAAERHFAHPRMLSNANDPEPAAEVGDPQTNVCVWTPADMDGQKMIWLQQVRHMDRSRFRFTFILSLSAGGHLDLLASPEEMSDMSLHKHLLLLQREQRLLDGSVLRIVDSPYNGFSVQLEDLKVAPQDGSAPASEVWQGELLLLYRYVHDRLLAAQGDIDAVSPAWCRGFYVTMRDMLLQQRCDVVVFGNSRGFSSDVFITDTARILGLPSATELLNLYLDPEVLADAVVGPSQYAVEHSSVRAVVDQVTLRQQGGAEPGKLNVLPLAPIDVRVIAPSVDCFGKFDPALYQDVPHDPKYGGCNGVVARRAEMGSQSHDHRPCFAVGFMARLAPEKSPGLFLTAARELLELYPFARFVVVGDGPLLESLQDLAGRLGISDRVTFTGWVGSEVPLALRGLDVVVNPSLRGWSETFCVANIEAMSMRVPLVTFAVGGVGEYVQSPAPVDASPADNTTEGRPPFTVSPNAVIVNTASSRAIALAVHHLITHPRLREELGRAGRQTVTERFHLARQMDQYSSLYSALQRQKRSREY